MRIRNFMTTLVALSLLLIAVDAQALTITFENITEANMQGSWIVGDYEGFTWQDFHVFDTSDPNPLWLNSGYVRGLISGRYVGFSPGGLTAYVGRSTPFDFEEAYFTAAWDNQLQVIVTGYNGAELKYQQQFTVSPDGPTLQVFDFRNIDRLAIVSFGGTNAGLGGFGNQAVIDDMVFNVEPVPEPSSLVLLGTGVLGLAGRAWRRRRG